jgi:signal transduction histidine kinase
MNGSMTNSAVPEAGFRAIRPDGGVRWVANFTKAKYDGCGQAPGLAGAPPDVTAQCQLAKESKQSQKMAAIATLPDGIVHDFNNILSVILGNVELAKADVGPDHPALESLEEILGAARRADDLLRQLVSCSRKAAGPREILSLVDFVGETAGFVRAMLPAGIELNISAAVDSPRVLADSAALRKVLVSLCTNAFQALKGNVGRIEITLEGVTMDAGTSRGVRGLVPGARYACLAVVDNGTGMDDATMQRIFEPFFTTRPKHGTKGLGLSAACGIAQDHEGALRVTSRPGEGTAFSIYLPAFENSSRLPHEFSNTSLSRKTHSPRRRRRGFAFSNETGT